MREPEQVIIVGAGGHAREVAHVLSAVQRSAGAAHLLGFAGDGDADRDLLTPHGAFLGSIAEALERHPDAHVIGGVGDGRLRERLVGGHAAADPLVHPLADVGAQVSLARGVVVCSHASLTTDIEVGEHVHISRGAAVGHDAVLEDFASVMPLASVSGNVRIGRGAFVGTGALIRQGVRIGAGAVVGMGAVVLTDVPPGATVVGNPARQVRAADRPTGGS